MSDDIEHRVREELQELLDENPQIAPTQFIDGDKLATVSVADGRAPDRQKRAPRGHAL